MQHIENITDIKINDWVYYVPDHLESLVDNASKGIVTLIKGDTIWVRFRGPTGELCQLKNLYK